MQETDVQHRASLSEFKEFQVICVGADVVFFPDYATFYAPSKTLMHCVDVKFSGRKEVSSAGNIPLSEGEDSTLEGYR